MDQSTLVLISAIAPKEPDWKSADEWSDSFEKEYPPPWTPVFNDEWFDASIACAMATYPDGCLGMDARSFAEMRVMSEMRMIHLKKSGEYWAWAEFRRGFREDWARNEWPLIWAKKRMQAAENKQHNCDER